MKKHRLLGVFFLIGMLYLGGCAGEEDMKPVSIVIFDDIISLDPAGTKDVLSEVVARCVFDTLYRFEENTELTPCLAESAEQASDLEWIFKLKEKRKFQDGSLITAEDVVFSVERALADPKADGSLLVIDRLEAVDKYTFKVYTKEPVFRLEELFARTSTAVMSKKAMEKADYDINKPVGSGAYKVIEWVKGKEVCLEKSRYYGESESTKLLTFIVEPSEQNGTAALLSGEADIIFRVSSNDADYLNINEDIRLYQNDSSKMELLVLNPKKEPLQDIRVRQAIACAIDKQNIVDNVIEGYGNTLNSVIPNSVLGYIKFNEYGFNPQKSRELLDEAGYPEGFELTVLTFGEQRKKMMEYLKLDLAKVNISLNYECLELKDYFDIIEENGHMASVMRWVSNPDPDSTFTQLFSKEGSPAMNQSGFANERVEELIAEGRRETQMDKRKRIYEEACGIVASSYNVIPIYQPYVLVAARNNIGGIQINSQGMYGLEKLFRE